MVDITDSNQTRMLRRPFSVKTQTGFTEMAIICFFLLYAPLIPLVVYSFNAGTSIAFWEGAPRPGLAPAGRNTTFQPIQPSKHELEGRVLLV